RKTRRPYLPPCGRPVQDARREVGSPSPPGWKKERNEGRSGANGGIRDHRPSRRGRSRPPTEPLRVPRSRRRRVEERGSFPPCPAGGGRHAHVTGSSRGCPDQP